MTSPAVTAPKPRMAAIGTFDGVHTGHRAMLADLARVSAEAGFSPVAVTFSRHPLEIIAPQRAPRLLMPADSRIGALRQAAGDVIVLDFDEKMRALTAQQFMTMLRDDYNVGAVYMGFNHHFGSDRLNDFADYQAAAAPLGIRLFKGTEAQADGHKVSSSVIRSLVEKGEMEEAALCLGRRYALTGIVGPGRQLGRRLGFPTANITPLEPRQAIPASGVYACFAVTPDGVRRHAAVNIGTRPTVAADGLTTIEAHIIGFTGDLYGQQLTLEFRRRLRPERRFDNPDALAGQIARDIADARL